VPNSNINEIILSVSNLTVEFETRKGDFEAVRNISFDVERSQKVGIVGESGCGKSVTALAILKLIEQPGRITSGRTILKGRDISSYSDREMQSIRGKEMSLIFQDPLTSLDPVMTIGNQIIEVIRKHQKGVSKREAREKAIDLLRDVEVPNAENRLDDYPHQYSGGMRQRVMIAIALANDPDILIADEPTTALDVTTQAQVLHILEKLVYERQTAVILITHNFGLVAEFCDKVLVMYAGKIVEQADKDQIFLSQNHPYTEALLKSVPHPNMVETGELPTIPGLPPSITNLPPGCSFEPRCPIGKGLDICKLTIPSPIHLEDNSNIVISECHFAEERWNKDT
jgi:oligopeptide/dipeptide ABC transporter ATP-binding protein